MPQLCYASLSERVRRMSVSWISNRSRLLPILSSLLPVRATLKASRSRSRVSTARHTHSVVAICHRQAQPRADSVPRMHRALKLQPVPPHQTRSKLLRRKQTLVRTQPPGSLVGVEVMYMPWPLVNESFSRNMRIFSTLQHQRTYGFASSASMKVSLVSRHTL
jgi:hypothetical protein